MASGPIVKVSFIGDAGDLSKSIGDVDKQLAGVSADLSKHSTKMSGAFKKMGKDAEHGFKGVRDSADDTERRITGFRDSLTGSADVMKGIREGDMVALATGFADIASSVANLGADLLDWGKKALEGAKGVVQAHAASVAAKAHDIAAAVAHRVATIASTVATQAQAAAQWALNAAMSANPILLVVVAIAALAAGLVVAYQKVGWFRDAVDATFNWIKDHWPLLVAILTGPIGLAVLAIVKHWDTIRSTVAELWTNIVTIFGDVRDVIEDAFSGAARFIKSVFAGVFNFIAEGIESVVNGFVSAFNGSLIRGINVLNPFGDVPKLDKIGLPRFDRGGVMPGPIGQPGLALLHGGETVLPTHRGGSSNTYNITVNSLDPRSAADAVVAAIAEYEARNGFVPIRRIQHRNAR